MRSLGVGLDVDVCSLPDRDRLTDKGYLQAPLSSATKARTRTRTFSPSATRLYRIG